MLFSNNYHPAPTATDTHLMHLEAAGLDYTPSLATLKEDLAEDLALLEGL